MISKDGNGQILNEGDRVCSSDFDGTMVYGTIHKNDEYPHVSEWYIKYDDGEELAVLEDKLVFKINSRNYLYENILPIS